MFKSSGTIPTTPPVFDVSSAATVDLHSFDSEITNTIRAFALYDITQLVQAAQSRWLKPAEVLYILQNHESSQITQKAPQKPSSGSLFLFNRRVLRFFRKDGHNWRKKRDGRNVGEAHERLKVGNAEALNCYYAHGEDNPNFQRRSYWMLDSAYEHIVLVHYREITEGKPNSGSISEFTPGSSYSFSQSPNNLGIQYQGTTSLSDLHLSHQSLSSPVSIEVCSGIVSESQGIGHLNTLDGGGDVSTSPEIGVGHALRRLEEQLSLDDNKFKQYLPFGSNKFASGKQGSASLSDIHGSYQSQSSSGTVEVISAAVVEGQRMDKAAAHTSTSPQIEVHHALWKLEEQLSLDDKFKEDFSYDNQNNDYGCALPGYDSAIQKMDQATTLQQSHFYESHRSAHYEGIGNQHNLLGGSYEGQTRESLSWNDVFELSTGQSLVLPQTNEIYSSYGRDKQLLSSKGAADKEQDKYQHCHSDGNLCCVLVLTAALNPSGARNAASSLMPRDFQSFNMPASHNTSGINTPGRYSMICKSGQFQMPLGADSSPTIAQEQKFKIKAISPEWGFAYEVTKVIIVGSFFSSPSEVTLACMIGDIEVPVQIIQDGVLCCQAPPSRPGKATFCITSGNREACSEVRGFEFIDKYNACNNCISQPQEDRKSLEELLLVVRLGQMLDSDSTMQKREGTDLGIDSSRRQGQDSWVQIMDDILTGNETSRGIMDKVLQELIKDKLQQWLSSRALDVNNLGCALSKKEQGILHIIAGLGYEWALNSILAYGVGVNFRDISGWTALHWAARFGREKMVAALIAYGASPGAVTDPTEQDPVGKTPASIASECGHKGLAGYLSELALTTHLSSLTLKETELSKCSAAVEAEATVGNISSEIVSSEDQQSMKQTLAAVRNAAQAAARIQSAFRAHSFRKRQLNEAAISGSGMDEYGFSSDEIQGLSAASKLVFRHLHDHNIAALSIQKNYRSWKGRKDFLALRQKVVKIQAHIRGYQARKKYKVICWAVGIYDKVVLRWRRKGAGLRVYKPDAKSIDEEEEDEDILKSFRKQKVDVAIDEAVSRVLCMVDCPEARQQYNRMLERFQEAKAELDILADEVASTSQSNVLAMDDNEMYQFP
ncbi:hypothetical protein V2J09_019912 [Rumex salicifolius]